MRTPRTGSLIVLGLAIVAVSVIVSMIGPWGQSSTVAPGPSPGPTPGPGLESAGSSASASLDGFGDDGTWVHVVGSVTEPGIYLVPAGSRVIDAIMSAGGLLETADQCGINLARPLSDGEQLIVPSKPEGEATSGCQTVTSGGSSGGASGLISLSRADLATLDSLPGIGPTLAQRIIDWRTANGGFTSVDQLADVGGIGDKLFSQLQPLVTP
ncbi:unannotated protein [freshwater metagenome]|uniref:Unannotated protein n=1 Tax=freshwater metagenome TaxID=449393 RepID=A0A6J6E348_9ZZZZ